MTTSTIRWVATRIVCAVLKGYSLADKLESALHALSDPRDRAWVQAVCYGVCRYYTRLDIILSFLLKKPLKEKDSDLYALLLIGLYQLLYMRVPPHAAVAETVNVTDQLKKTWARGLVNAILRGFLRERDSLEKKWMQDEEAFYAHPAWWIGKIKKAWPNHWQSILTANNEHPPFSIRVNQKQVSREAYLQTLIDHHAEAILIPETQHGIRLIEAIEAEALPGFAQGYVTVQDGAAQLAGEWLDLSKGLRVLDACAAPGGKLTHLLEIEPTLDVVAVEKEAKRVAAMQANLARHQASVTVICHDVLDVDGWWRGEPFDRILLDAPCSASGVIRRHPDIKLLRQPADIQALAKQQSALLATLWPLLKPHGLLLYATCSIFPDENEKIVQAFLKNHPNASIDRLPVSWGVACQAGQQLLPGMHQMDGFYYARLRKLP